MIGLMTLMVLSGVFIFFEDQVTGLVSLLNFDQRKSIDQSGQALHLTYLFAPKDLNPYSNDLATAARLQDVYQGLVFLDENLNTRPGLAVSYGLVEDRIWEITLREGVLFHDGSTLEVSDVIYSLGLAKKNATGPVADLIASVEGFEKTGLITLKITTKKPDPLFLNKLAKMPVLPDGFEDFSQPVGTGPYRLVDAKDLNKIIYQRFDKYWHDLPYFPEVIVRAMTSKNERVDSLLNGETDFLVNVPPDVVEEIKSGGFKIEIIPSLEVGFVMFNINDLNFSKTALRKAIAKGLSKNKFLDLAMGYAKTINQFIPNGVFGYNPDLIGFVHNQQESEKEIASVISNYEKLKVKFFFPESLKLLGQYFKEQLIGIGLDIELNPLGDLELQEKIQAQSLPFYYLGWRNDSGDALPFLKSVLHSKQSDLYGAFNGMSYKNIQVDKLIEKSETNLNQQDRLKDMQEVMRLAVEVDVVGVPLFETQSLFAYRSDLVFNPRLDSLVYPSQIRKK